MWHEFDTRRLDAENARHRMRAYHNRYLEPRFDDRMQDRTHGESAVAESQDVAIIALEEAELATLNAILNKVEAKL